MSWQHTHEWGEPHQAPRDCPVCGEHLATTRLGCTSCGTEVSGLFASCSYCGLDAHEREMLRVFLVSRGNMKELERFLEVSYPTARQRFAELLVKLELTEPDTPAEPEASAEPDAEEVLRRLAAGQISVPAAERILERLVPTPERED
jgi:hypothetical protein